jgi:predicted metal-dependent hydrolase
VLKKLAERTGNRPQPLVVRDGASLPLLGGTIQLRVVPGSNRIVWNDDGLTLAARADADLPALARRALQRRALALFGERLALICARAGRTAPALALSSARTRWGSCSLETGIRLNWRLIHLPLALIDYVVAHEVAHLAEMNHGKRFWAEVERLFPDWRTARAELRRLADALPRI